MFSASRVSSSMLPVIFALSVAGCLGTSTETSVPPGTVDTHDHPTEGPHGGGLVELGNEEYHAELVNDDAAGTVTVYVLDSAAKTAVPIEASEVTINLKHDGQAEQFKIAASADPSDPPGKFSRFVATDTELAEGLDHEGAEAQLVLMINGRQYRGAITHEHEDAH
jgi:hypothetical protein